MHIQAAVARAPHTLLHHETLQMALPRAMEIRVRLVATGVCHTDIAMRDQLLPTPAPAVLGHEGAGVVEAVGSAVTRVASGDHVVMSFNSCGQCPSCFDGQPSYCHDFSACNFHGARLDGSSALSCDGEFIHANVFGQSSFASHAICHERNAVAVDSAVDLARLGPLGCGVQTGAGAIFNSLGVAPDESIAIWGVGGVGASAVMAAHAVGAASIVAVDKNDARLALAREFGATLTLNPDRDDVADALCHAFAAGLNYSIDTTSDPVAIETAIGALAPRGTCGVMGAVEPGSTVALDLFPMMTEGRCVRGIVEGDSVAERFIPALISLYRQGRFPFDRLIRFYPFSEINQAIADMEAGRVIKPVIRFDGCEAAQPG